MIVPLVLVLLALVACSSAASDPIAIVSQRQDIGPDGSYSYKWESANGITVEESGSLKNPGQQNEAEVVLGAASWTAPDGTKIDLGWNADENGAVFQGSHLPTQPPAPEIPAAIQRALDWIATHPYKEESKNKL